MVCQFNGFLCLIIHDHCVRGGDRPRISMGKSGWEFRTYKKHVTFTTCENWASSARASQFLLVYAYKHDNGITIHTIYGIWDRTALQQFVKRSFYKSINLINSCNAVIENNYDFVKLFEYLKTWNTYQFTIFHYIKNL